MQVQLAHHACCLVPALRYDHGARSHRCRSPVHLAPPLTLQPMSLDYDQWSVIALVLSVIHAGFVTNDATSHWLMGVQLIASYVLIALVFWFR